MLTNFQDISVPQICKMIDLLRTCMDDYLYVYDFTEDYYYISPHAASRFFLKENSFHNVVEAHRQFVYPPDYPLLEEDLNLVLSGKQHFHNLDYRWLDKNGQPVWINCRGYVVCKDQTPLYMIGCINEIGKRQRADNISGLLGLASFQSFLKTAAESGSPISFLRLGLDDFKEINEKHGMEFGDMILRETAKCITDCIGPFQKLYKLNADEFMIADFTGEKDSLQRIAAKIRKAISQFVEATHYTAIFTISGGLLDYADTNDLSFDTIMRLSEFALNEAKSRGKNCLYCFLPDDYTHFLHKKELAQFLQKSVCHNFHGFDVYFQPLFRADSGTLYGAEALMRFSTDSGSMISPAEFIPILEETGLIIPAGRWIMIQALSRCKEIQAYIPDFRININISYIQLIKSNIIEEVVATVRKYGMDPSCVVLELTESGFLDSDVRFSSLWKYLRQEGIRLALDDFGTGYSNFHYLYDLRPDIIKIDRSFVAKAMEDEYEFNLLSLMSGMVHSLNLKICIEGIENEYEQNRVNHLEPDIEQGFYFGRPCLYEKFMQDFVNVEKV